MLKGSRPTIGRRMRASTFSVPTRRTGIGIPSADIMSPKMQS